MRTIKSRQLTFAVVLGVATALVGITGSNADAQEAAHRTQTLVGSSNNGDRFTVVNTDWRWNLAAETCVGQGSDYYVILIGPKKLGDGSYHQTTEVELGLKVSRKNLNTGGTLNSVWVRCSWCLFSGASEKWNAYVADYLPADWMQINQQNGYYNIFLGSGGGWVMSISETEAGTDKFTQLRIGGETDPDSELGPFEHYRNLHKKSPGVVGSWFAYQPDDWSTPRDIDEFTGVASVWHSDGTVVVADFGGPFCQ